MIEGRPWRDDRDDGITLARTGRRREAFPLLRRAQAGARPSRPIPHCRPRPAPALRTAAHRIGELFETQHELHGPAATLAAYAARTAGCDVVVLGAHAHADADDPAAGYLALAPDPGRHDGVARPAELAGIPVDARLVVLMACGSGAGPITGDGVLGLGRAFLLAGARAVLVTLWPVGDRDAPDLVFRMLRVLRTEDSWPGRGAPAGPAGATPWLVGVRTRRRRPVGPRPSFDPVRGGGSAGGLRVVGRDHRGSARALVGATGVRTMTLHLDPDPAITPVVSAGENGPRRVGGGRAGCGALGHANSPISR